MAEFLFALVLSLVFGMFAFNFFPVFHVMLEGIDTTNMPYFLRAMVVAMPYAILFVIIYTLTLYFKSKRQG
jgi:hypothetical protein